MFAMKSFAVVLLVVMKVAEAGKSLEDKIKSFKIPKESDRQCKAQFGDLIRSLDGNERWANDSKWFALIYA